nr:immunoglobulin light chain junction region [Macaca mulatta]
DYYYMLYMGSGISLF